MIPSFTVLGLIALAAVALTFQRPSPVILLPQRSAATRALVIAICAQGVHFAEEWVTGFHIEFPAVFGFSAIPPAVFLAFNLGWIALWIMSAVFLPRGRSWAFFAAWFLALAGTLNGLAHPLLALASGRYFPGVVSAPLVGLACVFLLLRLIRATGKPSREPDSGA